MTALRPLALVLALAVAALVPAPARAQEGPITRIELSSGRSYPVAAPAAITRVSVADTAVMDLVVVSDREFVINGRRSGEADAIVWLANGLRQHYRVMVRSQSDRMQIILYVKFAEVRRNILEQLGVNWYYRGNSVAGGTGIGSNDNNVRNDPVTGRPTGLVSTGTDQFISVITNLGSDRLLALIQAEQQRGNARMLAEPNLMAGNRDTATFLAGGELPIPIVQGGGGNGLQSVSITYREFGVKLKFVGEIISDELLRLSVIPEVSSLDYSNAVTLQGFRIPALRTRRMTSTLDVRRDQSLVVSGMFDNEQERVKTGVPYLKDIPILGALFSSTSFQRNETELLVIVRPVIIDPNRPRPVDVVPTPPDSVPKEILKRPKPITDPFKKP